MSMNLIQYRGQFHSSESRNSNEKWNDFHLHPLRKKAFINLLSPAAQPLRYYQLARALLQVISSNLLLGTYLVNSKVFE